MRILKRIGIRSDSQTGNYSDSWMIENDSYDVRKRGVPEKVV
jgi:hypothetical protein